MKKYKVLFADDEHWIREKMRNIISWEDYSFQFLEPACNGEEVLEIIRTEKPDILITDICMPYLSGVELLEHVHKEHPEIITFVISGYEDFCYVKNAFLFGTINYLIKPVNKVELVNALSKALEIIGERKRQKAEEEKQYIELQKKASFIQDWEFSQILDVKFSGSQGQMELNDYTEFSCASLVMIKIHNLHHLKKYYNVDWSMLSYYVKKKFRDVTGMELKMIFNNIQHLDEFLIVTEKSGREMSDLVNGIFKELVYDAGCIITVIESEHCYSMDDIYKAYIQDISCLMQRKFGKKSIYLKAEEMNGNSQITSRINESQFKEMQVLFKTANINALKEWLFHKMELNFCEEQDWSYLEVRQTVGKFTNYMMEIASEKMSSLSISEAQSFIEMADKVIGEMDIHSLCEILNEVIELFFNVQCEEACDSVKSRIQQAVAYVEIHCQENLKLSDLADKYHIERCYFSRMFHKETGENLISFISNKRIQKAIEYMKDREIGLTEIAYMVGYDDYTYFSKVFRKITGKRPRDYRNWMNGCEN